MISASVFNGISVKVLESNRERSHKVFGEHYQFHIKDPCGEIETFSLYKYVSFQIYLHQNKLSKRVGESTFLSLQFNLDYIYICLDLVYQVKHREQIWNYKVDHKNINYKNAIKDL